VALVGCAACLPTGLAALEEARVVFLEAQSLHGSQSLSKLSQSPVQHGLHLARVRRGRGTKQPCFVHTTPSGTSTWKCGVTCSVGHVVHVAPPVKGDVWRFNAYRLEHLGE
jgi:hypothetical protein